jgi:hypothetical protein
VKPVRACFFSATVAAFIGLLACETSSTGWYTGSANGYATCAQATTCTTCTPIVGCGWCQMPDGTGKCVADPNDCESAKIFAWTWDPGGCRTPVDASSVSVQERRDAEPADASTASDASLDAPAAD